MLYRIVPAQAVVGQNHSTTAFRWFSALERDSKRMKQNVDERLETPLDSHGGPGRLFRR